MEGGGYNNPNPFPRGGGPGYPARGGAAAPAAGAPGGYGYYPQQHYQMQGGYPPQQQQQHYAQQQAGAAAPGGYHPQQATPQQQQQYQQQYYQQQQQQYAPQGQVARGGYQQQQPYGRGGYVPQQGYGQQMQGGYPQQQQQYAQYQQYPSQQYQQQQQQPYGGGGRGRGGFQHRGGFHQQQQQQHYGGGRGGAHFNRGNFRGGRGGRGGNGGFNQNRFDQYYMVHVDTFAQLMEVGRKGSFEGIVPAEVMTAMTTRARGGTMRILVIVGKQYLAGCVSVPRSSDDVVLTEATATQFMNVAAVLCDDGSRLADAASGFHVARHLFQQLRFTLTQLVPFDQTPTSEQPIPDVYEENATTLLTECLVRRSVFDAVRTALDEDSERASQLFSKFLALSNKTTAVPDTVEEENGDTASEAKTVPSAASPVPAKRSPVPAKWSRVVTLFSSAQAIKLLSVAMQHAASRVVFFAALRDYEGSLSEELFKSYFCGVFTVQMIFDCFGVVVPGSNNPPRAMNSEEVTVICDCFARYGISIVCGNGGSCLLAALLRALRPNFTSYEHPGGITAAAAASAKRAGAKRGRENDDEATNGNAAATTRTEDGASAALKKAEQPEMTRVAASLAEYTIAEPPSDWRIFYAAAAAFTTGLFTPKPAPAAAAAATAATGEAAEKPVEAEESASSNDDLAARVRLLTQHIIACRAVQSLLPHFAESLLEMEKGVKAKGKTKAAMAEAAAQATYHEHCKAFLIEMSRGGKDLMSHNHGNYVAQTLIAELSPRAVPGTIVESVLCTVLGTIISNICDVAVQKFSSNCVERAILNSGRLADGNQFILRSARAVLERGDDKLVEMSTNQFGNYVVRHLGEALTALATGTGPAADAEEVKQGKELEQQFYNKLNSSFVKLQRSRCSVGIISWIQAQHARLAPESAPAAPTDAATAAAEPVATSL